MSLTALRELEMCDDEDNMGPGYRLDQNSMTGDLGHARVKRLSIHRVIDSSAFDIGSLDGKSRRRVSMKVR